MIDGPIPERTPLLSPHCREAATRAIAEADARRRQGKLTKASGETHPVEHNGPAGLEPVRYGDWEINGIAKDF